MRLAASRTFWTAGNKSAMRMAMTAITTSSSISVKPDRRLERGRCIGASPALASGAASEVAGEYLAVVTAAEELVRLVVDVLAQEVDRAVREHEVGAAGVARAEAP